MVHGSRLSQLDLIHYNIGNELAMPAYKMLTARPAQALENQEVLWQKSLNQS